jgi:phage tail sheath gpL-like
MGYSDAVTIDSVSRVVGYKLKNANFRESTPNLPQRIAILGEANTANQSGLALTPFEFINAKQVGDKYGYGSPLHSIARILRPLAGNLLGGIQTVIYPQISDGGATATVIKKGIAVATTVTANATHIIRVNGRNSIDGASYAYNLTVGMTASQVRAVIIDTINNALGCPCSAAEATNDIDFTSKWEGATSAELQIDFDTQDNAAGVVYSEVSKTDGTGVVSLAASLALFDAWNTIVINPYGTAQLDELEVFNGIPDPDNPTGRYLPTGFKPFMAFFGSVLDTIAGIEAITDTAARKVEVTNVLCPAPNSKGFTWEAAANMVLSIASTMQNNPHLGNGGVRYNDMPVPIDGDMGDFATYVGRNNLVKKGSSTVSLTDGKFTVEDCVTTYHPDGESPPKFKKVRDLNIDWNMAYGWLIVMQRDIQDKAIVENNVPIRVNNTISPKQAKQLAISFLTDKEGLALIADSAFSIASIEVGTNESNPARLDIFFRYKRTSTADVVSSDVEVDFAFPV